MEKKKKLKRIIIALAVIIVLALIAFSGYTTWQGNQQEAQKKLIDSQKEKIIEVKTTTITNHSEDNGNIKTVGSVVPETQIDVLALSQGTIESLPFDIGDKIQINQTLAYLKSNSTKTGFLNSQTNYYNMLNNLEATKRTTDEVVRQAELGVENAQEATNSAETALKSTQDNYTASLDLQVQTSITTNASAIISCDNYLQTVKDSLEDINYIINAEPGPQLSGIGQTLSAQNLAALNTAKTNYFVTKLEYDELKNITPNSSSIKIYLTKVVDLLRQTKIVVSDTVIVLDNTVSSNNFSQTTLTAQQVAFSSLYTQTVNTLQQAEAAANNLTTLELTQEKERLTLESSVDSANTQLNLARIAYSNSLIALNSSRQNKQQQILGAQTSVDSALGQLNLSQEQLADLTIKASIQGQITAKLVEVGAEISPGQKIAEIAQTDKVKVKVSLTSEDVYQIKVGQSAIINDNIEAEISSISPSADAVTKKVNVEILVDNKDGYLISGTFVDVQIKKTNSSIVQNGKIKLPLEAVNITQTENFVFLDNNSGVAIKRLVEIGETEINMIEITTGLAIGDQVIIEGARSLEDGDKIIVK